MTKNKKPVVICLEGIVGAGKTTQIDILQSTFLNQCQTIYELNDISPMKEVREDLRTTGRIANLSREDVIRLADARGKIHQRILQESSTSVLFMDRGIYTGMVFESGNLSLWEVEKINNDLGVVIPDLCFVLHCPARIALERIDARRKRVGKYSGRAFHETEEYIEMTREKYFAIARRRSIVLVETSGTEKEVSKKLIEEIHYAGIL